MSNYTKDPSFVESNWDEASPDNRTQSFTSSSVETRPDNSNIGGRAVPGDKGFLYADTPQSTVFIGKKQWLQNTWNYYIPDTSKKPSMGRLYETWKRDIYERILTRKLEWLSDHEAFTKLKNQLDAAVEFRKNDVTESSLDSSINKQDLDLTNLLDLEFAPTGFGGGTTTRYYTAPIAYTNAQKAYIKALTKLRKFQQFGGPNTAQEIEDALTQLDIDLGFQEQQLSINTDKANDAQKKLVDYYKKSQEGVEYITDKDGNSIPIGTAISLVTATRDQYLKMALQSSKNVAGLKQYQAELISKRSQVTESKSLDELIQDVEKAKVTALNELKQYKRLVPLEAFNGIIEFANVTSVNTSMSIHGGGGTASLTLENPKNLMKISKEDLILALSEDPYYTYQGDPQAVDVNKYPSLEETKEEDGKLFYYRGRYYNRAGLDTVINNSASINSLGFRNDPTSLLNATYKQIQQRIYNEIRQALSVNVNPVLKQRISYNLPTSSAQLTYALIEQISPNLKDLVGSDRVKQYKQDLSQIETKIKEVALYNSRESTITAPDQNVPDYKSEQASQTTPTTMDLMKFGVLKYLAGDIQKANPDLGKSPEQFAKDFYTDLKLHFQGKWLIEVADRIWIWLSSPSRTMQMKDESPLIESAIGNAAQSVVSASSQSATTPEVKVSNLSSVQQENLKKAQQKSAQSVGTQAGSPTFTQLRNSTYGGLEEVQYQVFEGVITQVTGSFSGTEYTLQVQAKDMSYYLEQARILQTPSLNEPRDTIFILNDPVYRKADPENIAQQNFFRDQGYDINNINEALVGRWKRGLYVTSHAIYDTSSRRALDDNQVPSSTAKTQEQINKIHGNSPFESLFTALDSANIISILVTGIPYNIATFATGLFEIGDLDIDRLQANGGVLAAPGSIVTALSNITKGENEILGNFKPFLELTTPYSEETIERLNASKKALRSSFTKKITTRSISSTSETEVKYPANPEIAIQYLDAADASYNKNVILGEDAKRKLQGKGLKVEQLELLGSEKETLSRYVSLRLQIDAYSSIQKTMKKQGEAVVKEVQAKGGEATTQQAALATTKVENQQAIASSKMKIINRQKSNYLIISDQYSANIDLQPYVQNISSANMSELWRSSFQSPLKICREVTDIVDFEFFCDENGHLRFKPPTYNYMLPEHWTTAQEMLPLRYVQGLKDLYPNFQYLLNAGLAQLVKTRLEEFQDTINAIIQDEPIDGVQSTSSIETLEKIKRISPESKEDELKYYLGLVQDAQEEFQEALQQAKQKEKEAETITALEQYKIKNSQDALNQLSKVLVKNWDAGIKDVLDVFKVDEDGLGWGKNHNLDLISAMRLEGEIKSLPVPGLIEENHVHKISPNIILNESFTEKGPDFCRVDVTGTQNFLPGQSQFASGTFFWAGGVDYDLWRDYGWRDSGSIQKPFIHDREASKIYCQLLLSRQKAKILSGSMTVRGDSKYRLADCVFIEDQDLYYYITAISHSFSYSGDYQTTLTLEYGRRPGEFIAHPFDAIGTIIANADERYLNEAYGVKDNKGNQK